MSVPAHVRHSAREVITEAYPVLGYSYGLTDIQTAIGRVQLERRSEMVAERRHLATRYAERHRWARSAVESEGTMSFLDSRTRSARQGVGKPVLRTEDARLLAWAAKRLRRPVKWTCERREAFLTDYQGRDLVSHAELALDTDGNFLALRGVNTSNVRAHAVSFIPLAKGVALTTSVPSFPYGCAVK